jgi:hypothetical protein
MALARALRSSARGRRGRLLVNRYRLLGDAECRSGFQRLFLLSYAAGKPRLLFPNNK